MRDDWRRRLIGHLFHRASTDTKIQVADLMNRSFEELTYRRVSKLGFRPDAIIDVGAYRGDWTILAQQQFGPVPSLMVEAQDSLAADLERVAKQFPDVRIINCLLDFTAGENRVFFEMGTGSSILSERSDVARHERTIVTRTLDDVVEQHFFGFKNIFLKLDVQGAELKVLGGGMKTLSKCALLQMEVALLQYNEGAPLMPDVVAFMAERDFLPIEISGFSRPRDYLVQIDVLFAPVGSALRPDRFSFD